MAAERGAGRRDGTPAKAVQRLSAPAPHRPLSLSAASTRPGNPSGDGNSAAARGSPGRGCTALSAVAVNTSSCVYIHICYILVVGMYITYIPACASCQHVEDAGPVRWGVSSEVQSHRTVQMRLRVKIWRGDGPESRYRCGFVRTG